MRNCLLSTSTGLNCGRSTRPARQASTQAPQHQTERYSLQAAIPHSTARTSKTIRFCGRLTRPERLSRLRQSRTAGSSLQRKIRCTLLIPMETRYGAGILTARSLHQLLLTETSISVRRLRKRSCTVSMRVTEVSSGLKA